MSAREARLEAHRDGTRVSRFTLEEGTGAVLGRSGADWSVEGEPHLSRRHARLRLEGGALVVERLPESANPIFSEGLERAQFRLAPGSHFVIGRTRFLFAKDPVGAAPTPAPEASLTLRAEELYSFDSGSRLKLRDLLALPEILRTQDEGQFYYHVASLLRIVTGARWAQVLAPEGAALGRESASDLPQEPHIPSRRLIERALAAPGETAFYRWKRPNAEAATLRDGVDWAVCVAAEVSGEPPLVFYAAGSDQGRSAGDAEDARLVGLVADATAKSLAVRRADARAGRLKRFFSDRVASVLDRSDPKELEPRLAQSTVMFFDIRGFSRRTEGNNQKILAHLADLRAALSAMTEEIQKEDGAVLQYFGDGILACWNVPGPDPRHVDRAVLAALAMVERLGRETDGWRCGIGLHTGEVVAGRMGSEQIFFYGLMGPVVNQASRIEGITKALEVPILASRELALQVSPEVAARVRLGRFQPVGMESAIELYELSRAPQDARRAEALERGVSALEAGRWEEAYEALAALPVQDRAARYLMFLAEHYRRHPPPSWRGVIEFTEK